ncbi:NUDIX hydrolase [Saccharopolyspora sp. 6V]|uniref:NUDIX hydrolase n=1 Tax=Saccharopolyspora sp. 6V TaxID=2877239 RepID=UPI001CD4E5C9|nr:NUDIX hydrolase [Saccharopolyspora sp. 6V]MCA1191662.1 NUDIX hydrolase [Saccharopolyspora sp. 6V]
MTDPAVAAAVIVRRGRVLLVRRRRPEGELVWQFPAEKLEPGESPVQAAIRETLEETTLTVSELKVLGDRIHPKTGREMHYVACEAASGFAAIGDEEELAAVAWARRDELAEYVPYGFYGPVQEYLDDALATPVAAE